MKLDMSKVFAFASLAAMDFSESLRTIDPRVKPLKELPPKPIGAATDDQRKPLLTGRRGKGTRKQRKGKHGSRMP